KLRGRRMANRASRSVTAQSPAGHAAERSLCTMRQSDVKTWVLALSFGLGLLFLPAAGAESPLDRLLTGVERRYNGAQTLAVDFSETYSILGRSKRPESGTL